VFGSGDQLPAFAHRAQASPEQFLPPLEAVGDVFAHVRLGLDDFPAE
jgi:hypothetical protein